MHKQNVVKTIKGDPNVKADPHAVMQGTKQEPGAKQEFIGIKRGDEYAPEIGQVGAPNYPMPGPEAPKVPQLP